MDGQKEMMTMMMMMIQVEDKIMVMMITIKVYRKQHNIDCSSLLVEGLLIILERTTDCWFVCVVSILDHSTCLHLVSSQQQQLLL